MACPLFLTKVLIHSGIARWLPAAQRLTDGGADFLRHYSDRVLAAPVAELERALPCLHAPGPDIIDLSLGAPLFDLMPSGGTKLPADRRGPPPLWGLPELRNVLTQKLNAEQGREERAEDEVLVTAGVAGAFSLFLDAFLNPGDGVVLFDPTSPLYRWSLRQRRARLRWVPTWTEQGRLRFEQDSLTYALRGSRLLVVTSPANPTGAVLADEDLEQIAWWAERREVLIFNDTAFERYRYDGPVPSITAQSRARRITLTAGGLSKGHALASARVGWLAGHRHLVRPCTLTAGLQAALVPTLCQQLAVAALQQDEATFAPVRAEFESRRRYTVERLQAAGLQPVWPAGAFFVWLPVAELGLNGAEFAGRLLQAKKVLLWPGEHFGPSGAGYVRLSFAAEDGRLREGLARLAELVRELRASPPITGPKRAA